ncbi:hypothetical protein BCCGELA001_05385 [Bradyrhizobium sp. CCGE-LA001]|nr:hypothetical protein BCCGELA001_05385 [Bradyrhizobium sp. CCGE-LA001]
MTIKHDEIDVLLEAKAHSFQQPTALPLMAHRCPAKCSVGRRLSGVERKLIAAVRTAEFDPNGHPVN